MTRGTAIVLLAVTAWLLAACGTGAATADGIAGDESATTASGDSGSSPLVAAQEERSGAGGAADPGDLKVLVDLAPSANDWSVPQTSLPDGESRLYVKFEGVKNAGIPIRNGGLVHMGDGLDAEVFIDPYPTDSLTAWLDLYLEMDGRPVSDARTVILYDMWSMSHGPYVGKSDAATDGHYVFRLDYIMFGAWEQVLEIRMPGTDEVQYLTVIVVAVP